MKKINLRIFMIASYRNYHIKFCSVCPDWSYNTHDKSNYLLSMMGSLWKVLRFPVFTILWKFIYSHFNIFFFATWSIFKLRFLRYYN